MLRSLLLNRYMMENPEVLLSYDEQRLANAALASLYTEWGYGSRSWGEYDVVGSLLQSWNRTVEMVEHEYPLDAAEYENDLDTRQHLGELVQRLDEPLREK